MVERKKGMRKKVLVGDLNIVRDFIDVRDVVYAYDLLLAKGQSGQVYNVCSGEGHKLKEILGMLQKKAGTNIPVEVDPYLIRPADNPVIIGSCRKLEKDTGFKRKHDLSRSLQDILSYWQARL